MTFKAYLDNIQAKTGKSPDEFLAMAKKKGFVENGRIVAKHSELLAWLKSEEGLGHGHANAIILYLRIQTNDPKLKEKMTKKKAPATSTSNLQSARKEARRSSNGKDEPLARS